MSMFPTDAEIRECLESENASLRRQFEAALQQISKLQEQECKMRSTLSWYANPENWKEQETGIGMFPSEAVKDSGARAIDILAELMDSSGKGAENVQAGD